jgi:hypothetical protein
MRRFVLLICLLGVCAGCGTLPNRLKRLGPVSASPSGPLADLCLSVEVEDAREYKAIFVMGAFNIIRTKARDHIDFIRSEFEMAARARGAKVGEQCLNSLNTRSVHVAIRELVYDSAWWWPITAHEFDVAMDVRIQNGSRTMMHESNDHSSTRAFFGGYTMKENSYRHISDLPELCSLTTRRLVESFYNDSQVEAFLKQSTEQSD